MEAQSTLLKAMSHNIWIYLILEKYSFKKIRVAFCKKHVCSLWGDER